MTLYLYLIIYFELPSYNFVLMSVGALNILSCQATNSRHSGLLIVSLSGHDQMMLVYLIARHFLTYELSRD